MAKRIDCARLLCAVSRLAGAVAYQLLAFLGLFDFSVAVAAAAAGGFLFALDSTLDVLLDPLAAGPSAFCLGSFCALFRILARDARDFSVRTRSAARALGR